LYIAATGSQEGIGPGFQQDIKSNFKLA